MKKIILFASVFAIVGCGLLTLPLNKFSNIDPTQEPATTLQSTLVPTLKPTTIHQSPTLFPMAPIDGHYLVDDTCAVQLNDNDMKIYFLGLSAFAYCQQFIDGGYYHAFDPLEPIYSKKPGRFEEILVCEEFDLATTEMQLTTKIMVTDTGMLLYGNNFCNEMQSNIATCGRALDCGSE